MFIVLQVTVPVIICTRSDCSSCIASIFFGARKICRRLSVDRINEFNLSWQTQWRKQNILELIVSFFHFCMLRPEVSSSISVTTVLSDYLVRFFFGSLKKVWHVLLKKILLLMHQK